VIKKYQYLDKVNFPYDIKNLKISELKILAEEVREEMIDVVSVTGGHLGAGLGVVELTIALHYVFDTPNDKIIWDVGHQTYPHKILTGRKDKMKTLRQGNGLSGFTKRSESEYDPFGAAHSSTSISAALGIATANKFEKKSNEVVAVIGDGAISAGMAYEAMNNAESLKTKIIVVLNDNDMSIAKPVGAMSAYLAKLLSGNIYFSLRETIKLIISAFSKRFSDKAGKAEDFLRSAVTGGTLFNSLGFYYVGPIDGYDLDRLILVLQNVKKLNHEGPIMIHIKTEKGKGYEFAEKSLDKYHGVGRFDVVTGKQDKPKSNATSYTNVFADALIQEAEKDDKIVAITAAMPSGTGLDKFCEAFPDRTFDVGIAEQHAVTFAAGMATEGYKPFATIYSTFLQRAYDQVVHDVAIQKLPVRFAIDRAGLVGADGATHAGSFDIAYLACLPDMVVMAAADEAELKNMVATAAHIDDRPTAFRFPRSEGLGVEMPEIGVPLEIGKGRILREGTSVALLTLGGRLREALKAADELASKGWSTTVADARFAKPLDQGMILRLAKEHEVLVTIEEGSVGGFAAHVMQFLANEGAFDKGLKFRAMTLPDLFIDHDKQEKQYELAGLKRIDIVATVMMALGEIGEGHEGITPASA